MGNVCRQSARCLRVAGQMVGFAEIQSLSGRGIWWRGTFGWKGRDASKELTEVTKTKKVGFTPTSTKFYRYRRR